MSANSEHVKTWRKRTKERIVRSLGGNCVCCGYDRCLNALQCHHLFDKDFSLAAIRANATNWARIVEEVRKCVLLCANCHAEVHNGVRIVPSDAPRFNESFVVYESLRDKMVTKPCPMCSKPIPLYRTTCSLVCAGKSRSKVNWNSVDLLTELQHSTFVAIAERLGCSDVAVHKQYKKLITTQATTRA